MKYKQENKDSIQSLFNQISDKYDTLNDLMSFGLHKSIKRRAVQRAVKLLGYTPTKILDVCTGTGDIAIYLKKEFPNAQVIGIDFSKNMLEVAKQSQDAKDIAFFERDVTQLEEESPFELESFDLIMVSFGLRNLPDIDAYMQKYQKYLKKGGVWTSLDVGTPLWFTKPYFYIHHNFIIPLFAKLTQKDTEPYDYLIVSTKNYPHQSVLCQKLRTHGYVDVENKNYSCGVIAQQLGKKN